MTTLRQDPSTQNFIASVRVTRRGDMDFISFQSISCRAEWLIWCRARSKGFCRPQRRVFRLDLSLISVIDGGAVVDVDRAVCAAGADSDAMFGPDPAPDFGGEG